MDKVVSLTQKLIQFPSITPCDHGCLDYIQSFLSSLGFDCKRFDHKEITNLFATKKTPGTFHLCFAGHVDVVSPLNEEVWSFPPFDGIIDNNILYGRGAVDMKGAIACFLSLLTEIHCNYSISILLTSDEEGSAENGTRIIIKELFKRGEKIDLCLMGEPTSEQYIGDTLKIGRRGSLNATLKIFGKAGHVAYPHKANNPIPMMMNLLQKLSGPLDKGCFGFSPSNCEITSIDVGNFVSNIIPENITAKFNIRFNPRYNEEKLIQHIRNICDEMNISYHLETSLSGEAFYGIEENKAQKIKKIIENVIGKNCELSTGGGTSDARFIKDLCPVVELGLKNDTAHHINECVTINDLLQLKKIYKRLIHHF